MAVIISGTEVAKKYKENMKDEIELLIEQGKRVPHLVVILVGEHPASMSYVKGKAKACAEIGMKNTLINLDESVSEAEVILEIDRLNQDSTVDGILVQLPLPAHINKEEIINMIDPEKDVDGFHPLNVGKMYLNQPCFLPCTPKGIIALLDSIDYDVTGKQAVILGRSKLVGAPVSQLLMQRNATITVCHSKTKNIEELCKQADILVAAIGKLEFVKAEWIKEGAVVIDVGVNRGDDGKLYGDVDFNSAIEVAGVITPVPGGVGPMTITMLLENTLQAYKWREKI